MAENEKKLLHLIRHKYIINSVNTKNKINRKEQASEMNHYYAFATTELLLAMSEEKQKAVYDFITMLKDLKQEKGEEKATNPTTKAEKPEPYEQNDTMRMIGRQNIVRYIDNEETSHSIQDIVQARGYDLRSVFDVVFDVFLYGCITGKREERAKKKATTQNRPK